MRFGRKRDYPPLLAPGRHMMKFIDIKPTFVDALPKNGRRLHLYHRFEEFVQAYLSSGIVCEIWLNGSFLTEKPEPDDIDATVLIGPDFRPLLTDEMYDLIDRTNQSAFGPDVDGFAFIMLDKDDPDYDDEQVNPGRTWHEQYGVEHSKEWLKGFAVVKVRETDVGLRICS